MKLAALADWYLRPLEQLLADDEWPAAHEQLLIALESGELRAAERQEDGSWKANAWVKQAILVGFRRSAVEQQAGPGFPFFDKSAYPARQLTLADQVRFVPGGSSLRRGAYLAPGVVVMPPAYVNVGAFIGAGTMVDSHALVGSCAQIGERVHLSAAAQIGGVLEPAHARPVVVEDEAFIGGLCGLFEGVVVRRRAVLAAGTILSASTPIFDLVHGSERRGEVPEGAVVVPGSRPAVSLKGADQLRLSRDGLQLCAALIIKYRDSKTDAATALETALR